MTGEAESSVPFSPDAIVALVEDLRRAGYNVGISEYIAVQDLLVALGARGQLPKEPERFRTLLGPLLANSPTEQADFGGHFDRWLIHLGESEDISEEKGASPSSEERRKELDRIAAGQRRWTLIRTASILLVMVGVLALSSYLMFSWRDTAVAVPAPVPVPEVSAAEPALRLSLYWVAIPLGLLLLIVIVYRLWWNAKAAQYLDRRAPTETATVRPLFVAGTASQLFRTAPLLQAARSLRKHELVDSPDLDVEATVEATVRNGGWILPVRRKRPRLPEYLALVDRAGPRDQRAHLVDALLDGLQREGLFITRYSFDGDPRLCFPPTLSEQPLRLDYLAAQFSGHRLWVFTEGDGFIDPVTGLTPRWVEQFEAWSSRTLFTFEAAANWGWREQALGRAGFRVLTASEDGLIDSADAAFEVRRSTVGQVSELPPLLPAMLVEEHRRWTGPDAPDPGIVEECLSEVRDYLGDARYTWLAACGVYPDLAWELTLFLGHRLESESGTGPRLLSLEHVAGLVRLPWFRAGYLPDWLRRRLMDDLSAAPDRAVRRALGELLLSSLDGPVDAFALEIAADNSHTLEQLWRRTVRRLRRQEDPEGVLHDRVFLTHMNGSLALQIPRQVGRLVRTAGRRLTHASRAMTPLIARPIWQAWATAAAMGWVVSALVTWFVFSGSVRDSQSAQYILTCSVPLVVLSVAVVLSASRHSSTFGHPRLLIELCILWTIGVVGVHVSDVTDAAAVAEFLMGKGIALIPSATLLSLSYFWLARQHRLHSPWDRFVDPIARVADASLPDQIARRLVVSFVTLLRTSRQPHETKPSSSLPLALRVDLYVHLVGICFVAWGVMFDRGSVFFAELLLVLNGLVVAWLSRRITRVGILIGVCSLVALPVPMLAGLSTDANLALISAYGIVCGLAILTLLVTVARIAILHTIGAVVAVASAWYDVETIVASGAILTVTGLWLAWRYRRQSAWVVAAGLSVPLISLFCFGLIAVNGWSPEDARWPVRIILSVFSVAFAALVAMSARKLQVRGSM